uniref:Uncharacterized protein LOC104218861 n=1 Tax=Nicotiana sylvestris TaxID=4096 RepID=A0A1U7VZD5_NICSY|nr:PREDICTED: uncharacterized protein LOC104218861 [Nicotiana sylvestris]
MEPRTYAEASANPFWVAAMKSDILALESNNTWTIKDLPLYKVPIGCKWEFKVKYRSMGDVERYKSRLLDKSYSQQEGLNYTETFYPVAKTITVRSLVALAAALHWCGGRRSGPGVTEADPVSQGKDCRCGVLDASTQAQKQRIGRRSGTELAHAISQKRGMFPQVHICLVVLWAQRRGYCEELGDLGEEVYMQIPYGFSSQGGIRRKSKRRGTISRSSAEAGFRSIATTVAEIKWLVRLFEELETAVELLMQLY